MTPYAVFGLLVSGGIVVQAAPIAGWSVGKRLGFVLGYYRRKGGVTAMTVN